MASETITQWGAQEKTAFTNFNEFVVTRLEDGIFRALAEVMKRDIKAYGKACVTLPWGTYSADIKQIGESGNINIAYEPSKAFIKALNGSNDIRHQDSFDPDYLRLFKNYVAWGMFDPDKQDLPARDKGLRLNDVEVEYLLNGYMNVLVTIANDKRRAGKMHRVEIKDGFRHGCFDFEYGEDETKVKFVPDRVFKQTLKDDNVAQVATAANYTTVDQDAIVYTPLILKKGISLKQRMKNSYKN